MKRRYLVAYDYGQGGLWAYVLASSEKEIVARFPELQVVDEEPSWMTGELKKQYEATTEDLDHPSGGLLGNLLRHRTPPS